MNAIEQIKQYVVKGNLRALVPLVEEQLSQGADPSALLQDGLLAAMDDIADRWADGSIFIPEVLVAARCMNACMEKIEPYLQKEDRASRGKIVFGTVQGDLHDIGKNLCILMLKAKSFDIVDIGVDVTPDQFVQAVQTHRPDVLCMSSLLTTSMPNFQTTIDALEAAGLRKGLSIGVGGAPVTDAFAKQIGADFYTPDAVSLARYLAARSEAPR